MEKRRELEKWAKALLRDGRLDEARSAYQRLCGLQPQDVDCLLNLAMISGRLGSFKEAEGYARHAVTLQPRLGVAYTLLGNALYHQGRLPEALAAYRAAATLLPQDPMTAYSYGNALCASSEPMAALEQYSKVPDGHPAFPHIHFARGTALEQLGRLGEAADHYARALLAEPDNVDARLGMGNICWKRGDASGTIQHCRTALAVRPHYAPAYSNLGLAFGVLGQWNEAAQAFRRAVDSDPQFLEAHVNLGDAYIVLGDLDAADASYEQALQRNPRLGKALAGKARLLDMRGDPMSAYETLEPAIRQGDTAVYILSAFAQICLHCARADAAIEPLRNALRGSTRLSPWERSDLYFQLGYLYEALSDHAAAFECFRIANESYPAAFDPTAHSRMVQKLMTVWNRSRLARLPRATHRSKLPIFIVGMPRSGTTLVEQILACHREVTGGGERPDIARLADSTGAATDPEVADRITSQILDEVAADYLQLTRTLGPHTTRVTDKMPHNFQYLWFIALAFPEAHVIHCTRDPKDTALSLYTHNLAGAHHYTYDLEHIVECYREYQRLMRHWKATLDIPVFEVSYENLVSNSETVILDMLNFCKLEWDPACLRPNETRRPVVTASYAEVRKPIHDLSVGKWRRYAEQLEPFLSRLDRTD